MVSGREDAEFAIERRLKWDFEGGSDISRHIIRTTRLMGGRRPGLYDGVLITC